MRTAQLTALIGEPNSGKTTFLKNVIDALVERGQKALVILPDDNEPAWMDCPLATVNWLERNPNWPGIVALEYTEEAMQGVLDLCKEKKIKDFQLILDDSNAYAQTLIPEPLKWLLKRKRQYMIDAWITGHGFSEIAVGFWTFITQVVLFKTSDDPYRKRNNIPSFEMHMKFKAMIDLKQPHKFIAYTSKGIRLK